MGVRINTIMQTCFFAISGVLPRTRPSPRSRRPSRRPTASAARRSSRRTTRPSTRRWPTCTRSRCPRRPPSDIKLPPVVSPEAPGFRPRSRRPDHRRPRRRDSRSAHMPVDGTFPTGTAEWEKRNIALEIPVWDEDICIQCGKCVLVCPHAVIRSKVYDEDSARGRSRELQVHRGPLEGLQGQEVHPAGRRRGLHRLRASASRSAR